MNAFDLDSGWFWKNVVARLLGGVFPGTWIHVADTASLHVGDDRMPGHMDLLDAMYSVLATPTLWIGVVAGIAMIVGAMRLRRWRDDN